MGRILTPQSVVAAGPTLTAAAAASCIPTGQKFSLRGGDWYVGRWLEVFLSGKISIANPNPGTGKFTCKVGSVVVCDLGAIVLDTVAAHTDVPWSLLAYLRCESVGASTAATIMGEGKFTSEVVNGSAVPPAACGVAQLPWATAPVAGTGFSSVADADFDVFYTPSAATGSLTVLQYRVREL